MLYARYARYKMHAIKYKREFFEPDYPDLLVRTLCMKNLVSCITIASNKIYTITATDSIVGTLLDEIPCIIIYLYADEALRYIEMLASK